MKTLIKNILIQFCLPALMFCFVYSAKSQTINWATETGLALGSTFTNGQTIYNFAGAGIDVTINVNIVNGAPRINATDGTKVDIGVADEASFTLTLINGTTTNISLLNNENLIRGERITVSNPDARDITVTQISNNGGNRMWVNGPAMNGPLPVSRTVGPIARVREQNNGVGTSWSASMDSITSFTWKYDSIFDGIGFHGNEGFILSLSNIALPVELINFNAQIDDLGINLTWETASELNNDYFTIEKSNDGITWVNIGEVNGQGTTSKMSKYEFVDRQPFAGLQYYRIKQTDFNGTFTYTEVQKVKMSDSEKISVFPNPADQVIRIENMEAENINLEITDAQGKIVTQYTMANNTDFNYLELDISKLPKGLYFAKTAHSAFKFTKL